METPPSKRKKIATEQMDIDPPSIILSPSSPLNSPNSPLPSSSSYSSSSSRRPRSPRTSSSSNLLHPHPYLRPRSPRTPPRSPLRSPSSSYLRSHSPVPSSPLRPSSPLPRSPLRSHSRSRSRSPARSVSPSPSRSPLHKQSSTSWEDNDEQIMMDDTDSTASTSPTGGRRRKHRERGEKGGEKHSLIASLKKLLSERLHSIKPVLLAWLQKYLGDQRLHDYINKLQFQINPSEFGTKFPVNVVASPIIPTDPTFLKISQELSRPILTDYPGIFLETDIPEELKKSSESRGISLNTMVAEVLTEIFGRCWDSLGGSIKFHGVANITIIGTHKYYDLVSRQKLNKS